MARRRSRSRRRSGRSGRRYATGFFQPITGIAWPFFTPEHAFLGYRPGWQGGLGDLARRGIPFLTLGFEPVDIPLPEPPRIPRPPRIPEPYFPEPYFPEIDYRDLPPLVMIPPPVVIPPPLPPPPPPMANFAPHPIPGAPLAGYGIGHQPFGVFPPGSIGGARYPGGGLGAQNFIPPRFGAPGVGGVLSNLDPLAGIGGGAENIIAGRIIPPGGGLGSALGAENYIPANVTTYPGPVYPSTSDPLSYQGYGGAAENYIPPNLGGVGPSAHYAAMSNPLSFQGYGGAAENYVPQNLTGYSPYAHHASSWNPQSFQGYGGSAENYIPPNITSAAAHYPTMYYPMSFQGHGGVWENYVPENLTGYATDSVTVGTAPAVKEGVATHIQSVEPVRVVTGGTIEHYTAASAVPVVVEPAHNLSYGRVPSVHIDRTVGAFEPIDQNPIFEAANQLSSAIASMTAEPVPPPMPLAARMQRLHMQRRVDSLRAAQLVARNSGSWGSYGLPQLFQAPF